MHAGIARASVKYIAHGQQSMAEIILLSQDPKAALKGVPDAVVVFFTSWCGDCARSEEYERKLADEYAGKVGFYRIDAEENEDIADKYGVERYPTYVYFINGKAARGTLPEPVAEGEVRNWLEIKISRNKGRRR